MRIGRFSRRFTPENVVEGDLLVEELRLDGARIPLGFRLFATGRIGPRFATTRYVIGSEAADAEVLLESDLGPALRGEHDPEPLLVWLEDTFGLCHSPRMEVGAERLAVAPKPRTIARDAIRPLLDHGIGPRAARQARRLPTEGAFDLREYQPGDDVRRIHWVRSLAAGELVVRLPDELPPDRPRVRLVLDTFFPEATALECNAPSEMLDALVAVWLSVARALAESGARVTLVTAVSEWPSAMPVRLDYSLRAPKAAFELGTRAAWQNKLPVETLFDDEATFVVSRGVLAVPPDSGRVRWIVVLPAFEELTWPLPSELRLPYPVGSSENRWTYRRRMLAESVQERMEQGNAVAAMRRNVAPSPPGSFAAVPVGDTVQLAVIR